MTDDQVANVMMRVGFIQQAVNDLRSETVLADMTPVKILVELLRTQIEDLCEYIEQGKVEDEQVWN
jgi:hypothetical protein